MFCTVNDLLPEQKIIVYIYQLVIILISRSIKMKRQLCVDVMEQSCNVMFYLQIPLMTTKRLLLPSCGSK